MSHHDDYDRLRRNLRILLPIWSLAVATAASLWIWRGVDSLTHELRSVKADERGVIVTVPSYARAIGPGTVLTAEDLVDIEIPEEYLSNEVLRHREEALGRVVVETVLAGDLVRGERLASFFQDGMEALVPRGQRAMALNLAPEGYVSDFIEPGHRVDVLAMFPEAEDLAPETKTLLQGVRVLAVDERMSETADGERVMVPQVTLLIEPSEAERLHHSGVVGKIKLSLRSELDFMPAASADEPVERIARVSRQMNLRDLRQNFSPEDFERMQQRLDGPPDVIPDLSPPEFEIE